MIVMMISDQHSVVLNLPKLLKLLTHNVSILYELSAQAEE